MKKIEITKTKENATINDALLKIGLLADKGVFKPATARGYVSAIKGLNSLRVDDESNLAKWAFDNVRDLAERWARKNGSPGTARTYQSRAKYALGEYLKILDDPFYVPSPPMRSSTTTRKSKTKTVSAKALPVAEQRKDIPQEEPGRVKGNYRLPSGVKIDFVVPKDLEMLDVVRFAAHLMTMTKDWDGRMLTLAKTDVGDALGRGN